MENYKKKYEDSLERCKKEFNFDNLAYSHEEIKQRLERVFPELKESEDERIRRGLIAKLSQDKELHHKEIAWLEKQSKQEQLYIRFGEIPADEKSKIYQGEIEVGTENGVSVYPAFKTDEGNIVLGLNLPITKTTLYTQQHLLEYDNRPCYLVKGNYVGKDFDGQPLINNISIIEKIDGYRIKEKNQGNQANPYSGISFEYNGHTWGMCARDNGVEILIDSNLKAFISLEKSFIYPVYPQPVLAPKSALEASKEEKINNQNCVKPADKIEPKFKVGDWITDGTSTFQIVKIEDEWYIADDGDKVCFYVVHQYYHLWTIQDAEDGDVLASDNGCPFIYKESNDTKAQFYCCVGITNRFCIGDDTIYCGYKESSKPATNKQYDLLFQKMKEAGYEWDAEKKELKKIESKSAKCIQWTGKNLKEVIDFTGKSARFDEWFKSWDEYEAYVHSHGDIFKLFCVDGSHYEVPVGAWIVKTPDGYNIPSSFRFVPKLAEWNEEDEDMFNNVIMCLDGNFKSDKSMINWIKSIKNRYTRKSDKE